MTAEQAAQLIDSTLDLVHQRLQDLQAQSLSGEQRALAAEFREWRHPSGGHIDLMVFPGLASYALKWADGFLHRLRPRSRPRPRQR